MVEIKTDRLLLREYREGDAARIAEIVNNKEVVRNMIKPFPFPFPLEMAKKWIETVREPGKRDKNFVVLFEGEIVGGLGFKLKSDRRLGVASVGFWLGEDYWGKEIGTESCGALVDYIFENYDVRRISVGIPAWDASAAIVLERCGFVNEGCLKNSLISFGKVCNECRYGLLRGEWEVLNDKI